MVKKEEILNWLKNIFRNRFRLGVFILLIFALGFLGWRTLGSRQKQPQYQTTQAEKGTLVTSISGSGTITSGNNTNVTTKVSGVVKKVYVTNGDTVVKGQKIAEVTLDDYAQERQTAAWVTYLEATEAVKEAEKAKVTADIDMWQARETILDSETDVNNNKGDTEGEKIVVKKTLDEARLAFNTAELKYKNADSDIANAKAKVSAALRSYQENSAILTAPSAGVISDLALAEGLVVSASSTTSSTSGATIVSVQTVGKINNPNGQLVASVSLTEIDIVNVKAKQKVTITLDAYSDKTFTGKILAVNTSGSISSGVTSYPVTILLDPVTIDIYPNMGVSVEIITNIKNDVVLVPSAAIQTTNNQSTVQVLKDGKVTSVQVETGSANDTQTEIVSGLNEGDTVITSVISTTTTTTGTSSRTGTTSSPFGSFGGGAMRINR